MRSLGHCLWKEWREFRSIAIGILVAVPLLLLLAGVLIPTKSFADPNVGSGFALLGALGALGMTLFALTTDLFAGEVRRGRIAFLDRTPAGLRVPFLAKTLVFLIGTSGAFLYGFVLAQLVVEWRGGSASLAELLMRTEYFPIPGRVLRPQVLLAALFVWGVFPIACMAPRGVLTLPLAALVFGGIAAGCLGVMAYAGVPPGHLGSTLFAWETQAFLFAAIFLIAYIAFVRGYRAGGGWPRAMRAGVLLILVAVVVPLAPSARAAMIVAGWSEGDPRIAAAYLSSDGNSAYIVRYSKVSEKKWVGLRARRVDLRTGNAEEIDAKLVQPPTGRWTSQLPVRWPYLRAGESLLDADTGKATTVAEESALIESRRVSTPYRTADGRRIWFHANRAVMRSRDGSRAVGEDELPGPELPAGLGVRFYRHGVFDTIRARFFETDARDVLVRPGRWLARQSARNAPRMLFDPESGEWSEALGIENDEWVASVHDDGRVFVYRPGSGLVLVDPESGERQVVRDSDGLALEPESFRDASPYGRCPVRAPSGARLFMLDGVPARFDASSGRLIRAKIRSSAPMELIGCADENVVFVLVGERRIERLELGTSKRTVIYSEKWNLNEPVSRFAVSR